MAIELAADDTLIQPSNEKCFCLIHEHETMTLNSNINII